jgi:hypothetical protein
MKRLFILTFVCTLFFNAAVKADEGMWLPMLLGDYAEAEMQRLGMKITADDIYNVNQPSLKDAVAMFGGGCTAEIISDKGLVLTNHHCGLSAIQGHSTIQTNYLINGFWARNFSEELSNPGLKMTFLVRMEDVTAAVLKDVVDNMDEYKRASVIEANIASIESNAVKGTKYQAKVKPFYYGNQYILIVSQTFSDIRLVAAPPYRIGSFGGDTDNWIWPRHTGDFAMFRIYAGADNQPADYSSTNVPYVPKKHLKISAKGVKEGDFTMVLGYPGTTQEYLTSFGVEMVAAVENPAMIRIREKRMEIMNRYMKDSKYTMIQYTAKYQGVSNYWKKMIGETNGVKRMDAINKKRELEKQFQDWANSSDVNKQKYGTLLAEFADAYKKATPLNLAFDYLYEAGIGVEIVKYANNYTKLSDLSKKANVTEKEIQDAVNGFKLGAKGYFKNYNVGLDRDMMAALFRIWYLNLDPVWQPDIIYSNGAKTKGDFNKFADHLFANSFMTSEEKVNEFLDNYSAKDVKKLDADPALKLAREIYGFYNKKIYPELSLVESHIEGLYSVYMKGLMEMMPAHKFYPDANSTLRVAYGTVGGFKPRDGLDYHYFTSLEGVIEKEDSLVHDYEVDDKLKQLYYTKDYGRWGDKDGSMHICFIASNHTTGGNSGSPVLDANGNLIGVNFDRVWEGTMSDLVFDPRQCRNITLDIRYVLFIIDKYADADYLIDEMDIVE